jgi:hypothetical protein
MSSPANADRPSQIVANRRREYRIAAVDGILNVAQDMSEADLMAPPETVLQRRQSRQRPPA